DSQRTYQKVLTLRLTVDGVLDASFNGTGFEVLDVGGTLQGIHFARPNAVAVGPDGSVVVGGHLEDTNSGLRDAFLLRLLPDGSPDAAFGTAGLVVSDFSRRDQQFVDNIADVVVLPGGGVMVAGTSFAYSELGPDAIFVARYDLAGRLDRGFGAGAGRFGNWSYRTNITPLDLFLDTAGRPMVMGQLYSQGLGIGRVTPDGSPDLGYGEE